MQEVPNALGRQTELMAQLVSALTSSASAPGTGEQGHKASSGPFLSAEKAALLPQVLASLHSSGHQQFKRQGEGQAGALADPDKPVLSARDVEEILAGVRGAIGHSLAEIKRSRSQSQPQASGGSLAPSSHFDDDSVNGSDDNCADYKAPAGGAASKKRKGLPPIAPVATKSEDLSDMPSHLTNEDAKRLKRRISNRECARRIRQRRQEQLLNLSGRIDTLRLENAKLMIRLTEVMKCWHEIAGENRMLKSQLSSMNKEAGSNPKANAVISALVNSSSSSGGVSAIMKVLERSQTKAAKPSAAADKPPAPSAKAPAPAKESLTPDGFAADALRAVLGPDSSGSQGGNELNPMDFLGVGNASIHSASQPSSDVPVHKANTQMLQSV